MVNQFNLPEGVVTIMRMLMLAGYENYLVGGSVRDLLRGQTPRDYDIVTKAPVSHLMEIFASLRVIATGFKHGTVTVLVNDLPIEVSTFRDNEELTLWGDLRKRDFTMNALAYSCLSGIIDYFDGEKDIKNHCIRAVGDAHERLHEDPLRLLRGLRFACTLGFDIEDRTATAIHDLAGLLGTVASERINNEFTKIITGEYFASVMIRYRDVFIHLLRSTGYEGPLNDYGNAIAVMEQLKPELLLRLSAFFLLVPSGDIESLKAVEKVLKTLKYDNRTVYNVRRLLEFKDFHLDADRIAARKLIQAAGADVLAELFLFREAIMITGHEEEKNKHDLEQMSHISNALIYEKSLFTLRNLKIKGDDLIKAGYKQDEHLKSVLNLLLKEVIEERLPNDYDALIQRATSLKNERP